jgi:hypothetical protein
VRTFQKHQPEQPARRRLLQPVVACARAQVLVVPTGHALEVQEKDMATTQNPRNPNAAADLPQAAPTLDPEAVVEQLRAMRAQIGEVTPLTSSERQQLLRRVKTSNPVLQASINMIGAHDQVSLAVAQPADGVRRLYEESNRWTAVEDELRTLLEGVAGANLVRRQRVALIAGQAYAIGTQLARDPANAVLLPHVEEIKRLKRATRRKKAGEAAQSPSPAPSSATPGSPKP